MPVSLFANSTPLSPEILTASMRLLSLTVRNYRIHKDLTVNFDPSRTLIGGPNESGKSTLAEAAHRALFLRAKTGGNLREEMRSSLHQGEPEVLLTFEAADTNWKLEKRFAGPKGSTLLTDGFGRVYRDDEAEAKLSEIHKCDTNGGRVNAGQLPALWSHLWVWQGRSGEEPSTHTAQQKENLVRHLQQDSVAAVLQSATDQRVASLITDSYNDLFTTTGRPKANSKPELARIRFEQTSDALQKAREAADRLAQAADDHNRAEREIAEITAILPRIRESRTGTEAKLRDVEVLRREEETQQRAAQAASIRREELESHDLKIRALRARLMTETAALQPADEKLHSLAQTEQSALSTSQTAEAALKKTSEVLRHARLLHELATATVNAFEKSENHQALVARVQEAAALQDELITLQAEFAKLPIVNAQDLARLRKLETTVTQANAALDAMATGIDLIESTAPVFLDGKPLKEGETRILADSGELHVGDARLRIRPGGGNSLSEARQQTNAALDTLSTALKKLALRDLEHAATALEQRQMLEPKIIGIEGRWKTLGGATLPTEIARANAERDTAHEELQRRIDFATDPTWVTPADLPSAKQLVVNTRDILAEAESKENTARQQAEFLRQKLNISSNDLIQHRDSTAAARQALRDLQTSIKTHEETQGDEIARTQTIAKARELETRTQAKLIAIRELLAALNPEFLAADLERFTRSLTAQENQLRQAENTRLLACDRLTLDGNNDPEAELRFAEARHSAAQGTYTSELRRAKAIEALNQLFTTSKEAIDRALVKPLADRITGYLQCLFGPGTEARVQLSDNGVESLELIRPGDPAFPFIALSGGAKEQVAAAVRLALAEILASDHEGTLPIIFDDAFVYSDPDRIQALQRMLDLAAVRGLQIIVLTCTPADYASLGGHIIQIASLN